MDPFAFGWPVDQDGYTIRVAGLGREIIEPRGGPPHYYRPLDQDDLWLRFAERCITREGALDFVGTFGLLTQREENSLALFLDTARQLKAINERLEKRDPAAAARLLFEPEGGTSRLPLMRVAPFFVPGTMLRKWEWRLVPHALRDALLHQAVEAITGNRRFRHCRNRGCPNWFRLGPSAAREGGRRQTITSRREFCSDRCRVAHARRQGREADAHA